MASPAFIARVAATVASTRRRAKRCTGREFYNAELRDAFRNATAAVVAMVQLGDDDDDDDGDDDDGDDDDDDDDDDDGDDDDSSLASSLSAAARSTASASGAAVLNATALHDALRGLVSKNGLFAPFMYKNEHFTKTGSDKHRENSKKLPFFLRSLLSVRFFRSDRAISRWCRCENGFTGHVLHVK